jgi:hypothetical protein
MLPEKTRRFTPAGYRLPLHASFNGSGDIRTYLVVLAIEA